MSDVEYSVFVDWNNDGSFALANEDVTDYVLARSPIQIQYGRDQARQHAPIQAGTANFELNNISKQFSPENPASPLAGNLKPGRPVKITAVHNAVEYVLYQGFLDDYDLFPDPFLPTVHFTALDALARFAGEEVSTGLYRAITTGTAIGHILDAIDWPALARDVDLGATTIAWWWEEGTDALTALTKVVNAEGPSAMVLVDSSGNFVFRDRHHRITQAASLTSQATFRDIGAEPNMSEPLVYDLGWRDIVNSVTFAIEERAPDAERSEVWSATGIAYQLAAGSELRIDVQAELPFRDAKTPVAGEDYTEFAQGSTYTVELSRTTGQSTTIIFTHTSGALPVLIGNLRLVARPVRVARTVQVKAEDAASIAEYGRRSYSKDVGWAGVNDARAIADLVLTQYAERLPVVAMRVVNGNDTRIVEQLGRDLSDRVTIVEASSDLNADFFVEQIKHTIGGRKGLHETVFGCEKVDPNPADAADTVFRFDTTGQGFNDGLFGH